MNDPEVQGNTLNGVVGARPLTVSRPRLTASPGGPMHCGRLLQTEHSTRLVQVTRRNLRSVELTYFSPSWGRTDQDPRWPSLI
jgi:hypothetical protein